MDLKLDIDPKKIEELIATKVLESGIGEQIKKIIIESLSKMSQSWDNPFKPIIETYIKQTAAEIVRTEFRAPIEKAIREKYTEELVQTCLVKFMSEAWK